MSDSFGNKVYSGLGEFSVIYSIIYLIIGLIISIVLFVIAIAIIRKKKVYTQAVTAKVTNSACSLVSGNNTTMYKCDIDIEYSVNEKDYVASLSKTSNIKYVKDSKIEIYYEKNNPENSSSSKDSNVASYILIPVGLIIIAIVVVNFILVRKYKGYAAISGGVTAASMIGRSFS